MRNVIIIILFLLTAIIFVSACSGTKKNYRGQPLAFQPDNQKLYDTIVYLDSVFFDAYNTCGVNLEKYGSFYADSIEFYHDKGGLATSKQDIIDATKRNICGKVTRELVKGSIEVYPINNYGAVEIGVHKFHNNTEKKNAPSKAGRFVVVWQNKNNEWKITRVISLH